MSDGAVNRPYLRDLRADAVRLQCDAGEWVVAGVEGHVPWPKEAQVLEFEEIDFILRPGDEQSSPTIVLNASAHGLSRQEAQNRILKLATALAWNERAKIDIHMWMSGTRPFGVGKWQGNVVQDFIAPDELVFSNDSAAWVALALYREALSVGNPFYSFLGFFKTVSSIYKDGRERGAWFREAMPLIQDNSAQKRIESLSTEGVDVAEYLFSEGRNAIAHAEKDVFVNPDSMIDFERISNDLPIMRGLAELAIEQQYSISSSRIKRYGGRPSTVELEQILGDELVIKLKSNTPIEEERQVELPETVSIVARRGPQSEALLEMQIFSLAQVEHGLRLLLTDKDEKFQFSIGIDLVERKLEFDPLQDMGRVVDLESSLGIDREIKFRQFQWLMFCNARIEIWNEENNLLLGKSDPFIPLNMMTDHRQHEAGMAELENRKKEIQESSK